MKRFGLFTCRAIIRVALSLLILGVGGVGLVLSFSTAPQKVAEKADGARVILVGTLGNQIEGDPVACLHALRRDSITYVIGQRQWPQEAVVLISGEKRTTAAGRAVVVEQRSWSVPIRWVPVSKLSGMIDQVPVPTVYARWLAAGCALVLVLVVARFTVRAIAVGFMAFIGLIAGSSLVHAAVDFNLINNSLLACAAFAASVIALTLGAARLLQ